jgi:rare lipoprotein A
MRPGTGIGKRRRARLGVGALMIGIPASAAAIGAGHAPPEPAPAPVHITPLSERISATQDFVVARETAVRVRARAIAALAGQTVEVRGRLLPALAGRKISLQARQNGAWRTLATSHTRAAGRFVVRYITRSVGRVPIRVRFAGDRLSRRATARVGEMTVYREAGASWYDDGGETACGFHAHYGVANRTLPCGTTVSFRYNGRSVTATVDDRGPYVGGRDWDLNQNTAAALGFGGVGTVWSSQ